MLYSQHLVEGNVLLNGGVAHVQNRGPHPVREGGDVEQPLRKNKKAQPKLHTVSTRSEEPLVSAEARGPY